MAREHPEATLPADTQEIPRPDEAGKMNAARPAALAVKQASRQLAPLNEAARNHALSEIAAAVAGAMEPLLAANGLDLDAAATLKAAGELGDAAIARLSLTWAKITE